MNDLAFFLGLGAGLFAALITGWLCYSIGKEHGVQEGKERFMQFYKEYLAHKEVGKI